MSTNCIRCVKNERTGMDLLCDECRANPSKCPEVLLPHLLSKAIPTLTKNFGSKLCHAQIQFKPNDTVKIIYTCDATAEDLAAIAAAAYGQHETRSS